MARGKEFSTSQIAEMLDVSTRTLNRWVEDGNIQYVKTGTGRYRFLESELKRILADTRYSLKSINPCAPSEFGVCGRASDARDRACFSRCTVQILRLWRREFVFRCLGLRPVVFVVDVRVFGRQRSRVANRLRTRRV